MPMTPNENEVITELTRVALELTDQVDSLRQDNQANVTELGKYTRKTRKMVRWLIVSLIFDLTLTLFLFHTSQRLDTVTTRINIAQTVQRQGALCPLYQIFLDSESPQARAASIDPEKYDAAFKVIHKGYDNLNCAQVKHLPAPSLRPTKGS